ncbi:alpha/beta fold hydrolase [Pseudarthrobacter sp. Y6]|uniref:alpha/beta fold hydrolase n=1 Tax=Pseudarthrobacter sp. Y6 TaxID=3418422 RepID=UPI003CF672F0
MTTTTHTLELADVDLVYDVHGPVPSVDGKPILVMIGQPMTADGFADLAAQFPDRTVVTYDPRGLGRSVVRRDGRTDQRPEDQAADLHALVEHLGAGKVDVFGSSGGAVAGLTWVATHPDDMHTLVAHEPPSTWALSHDADEADRAFDNVRQAYQSGGFGPGMAQFIALTMWPGEFTSEYFAQTPADPAMFGLPAQDDGSRDDPLLSERSLSVTRYAYDLDAVKASPARVVLGVGEETGNTITARTTHAVADRLGTPPVVFPSHHGGFVGGGPENPYAGKPVEFGATLRTVLDSLSR